MYSEFSLFQVEIAYQCVPIVHFLRWRKRCKSTILSNLFECLSRKSVTSSCKGNISTSCLGFLLVWAVRGDTSAWCLSGSLSISWSLSCRQKYVLSVLHSPQQRWHLNLCCTPSQTVIATSECTCALPRQAYANMQITALDSARRNLSLMVLFLMGKSIQIQSEKWRKKTLLSQFVFLFSIFCANQRKSNPTYCIHLLFEQSGMLECLSRNLVIVSEKH